MDADRGCTQGDIDSPIIFNVIVDAVIRTWRAQEDCGGSPSTFYADDGLLEHSDPVALQRDLDSLIHLFGRVGLKANEKKTKYMVVRGAPAPAAVDDLVYAKRQRTK